MEKPIYFGSNLKRHREACAMTQKQLAEQLGYTEKSVSKWEGGNSFPPVQTLLRLAELFQISLEQLIYEKTGECWFLGIDGGGTKTVFKLVDQQGVVQAVVEKGSSNPNDIGMENAKELLRQGITQVCRGIPFSKITMFAGLSGGGLTGDNVKQLNRFFDSFGFYAFDNGSDIENLISLADREKCILVIIGTGFIVYALNGERRKRISGWGQFFDEGSGGYTLGRDAITAVLRQEDGSGEQTLLTSLLEKRLGESAQAHLAKFYQGGKRYIAEFAELVFEAAACEDKMARQILEKNMAFAARMIDTAAANISVPEGEEIPVLFSGGICAKKAVLFPLIERYMTAGNCRLMQLEQEQIDGAVNRARKLFEERKRR